MTSAAAKVEALRASRDFAELLEVSARLGRDPLQVQGPGGNTSLKSDGVMLVKASGTLLADAVEKDIMAPVRSAALRDAILSPGRPLVEGPEFTIDDDNQLGLRPSIETSVHAVLDWPVVLHTHCVATIAAAVRADGEAFVKDRLSGLDPVFIPYVKPGAALAQAIVERVATSTRVIVLGNHGLVVCARTAREGEELVYEVAGRLEREAADGASVDVQFADMLAGTNWAPVDYGPTQAIAFDPVRLAMAAGSSLYPDHVIFLGPGVAVGRSYESVTDVLARAANGDAQQKLIVFEGRGVAAPADATPSMLALARALGDVLARIDPKVTINRLTPAEEADLLNWDAEKHRQALEKARAADASS